MMTKSISVKDENLPNEVYLDLILRKNILSRGKKMGGYDKTEVLAMEEELGAKPKWFIGKQVCSECKSVVSVRYDVYLKRVLKAKESDISEEAMNRAYQCRSCSGGHSVKKDAFYAMLKGEDAAGNEEEEETEDEGNEED